jgi:hypothetical protein
MRNLAKMLYPVDIEAGGLVTALQSLASNAEKILDVKCRFRCDTPVSMNNLEAKQPPYRSGAVTNAANMAKQKMPVNFY